MAYQIHQIFSGGQTGVDRAALDVADYYHLRWGGFCPRGGWAEDYLNPPGLIADYPLLVPTPQANPDQRSRWNVQRSDATLICLFGSANSPGVEVTINEANYLRRPLAVIDLALHDREQQFFRFAASLKPLSIVNIAGPRESEAPGIYQASYSFLEQTLPTVSVAAAELS